MRLMTARNMRGEEQLGAVVGSLFVDLQALGMEIDEEMPWTMLDLIDLGPQGASRIAGHLAEFGQSFPLGAAVPLSNVTPLAPIPRPRKNIFGIGLNYALHVDESARSLDTAKERPAQPVIFSKPPTAVIGPGQAIEHNGALTQQLDWEVELAVIIGARAKRVSVDAAMDYVFGYTVIIDVSARDCRRAGQWIVSKGQDTFAPMGPVIVTADDIPDPQSLNLSLTKNGETKQDGNTRDMLFTIAELISDISHSMTLEPGDIIATGTPDGVGAGRDPQEWLWPGDVVEARVEHIGTIRHPVVAI